MKLPNNIESEKVLINKCINKDPKALEDLIDFTSELFFDDANRAIFEKILNKLYAAEDFDVLSIHLDLENNKDYKDAGGKSYLDTILREYNYDYNPHLKNVREEYYKRSKLQLYVKAQIAIVEEKSLENLGSKLSEYEFALFELDRQFEDKKKSLENAGSLTDDSLLQIDKIINSEKKYTGVQTGIQLLDEATTGLHCGDSTLVAARPMVGKSSLANTIFDFHLNSNPDFVGAFFNLEMPKSQIIQRLISSIGHIPLSHIRSGRMSDFEWARFLYAMDVIKASNLYIDDSSSLSTVDLENKIKKLLLQKGKIDLVVVDYMQLMKPVGNKGSREQEVSQISRGIKLVAKSLNVPVIALSQLSRAPELRSDHRPVLSDLRDSGSSEQDADNVIFIYRDELYNPTVDNKGLAELIISKQRNGPQATIPTAFVGKFTKFMNTVRK